MNYIRLINSFWLRQMLQPLSPKAVCLYLAIVHCANRAGWPDRVSIPLSTLIALTGLSKSDIYRLRSELEKAGIVSITKGTTSKAAIYRLSCIIPECGTNPGTDFGTDPGTDPGKISKRNETKTGEGPAGLEEWFADEEI